MNLDLIKRLGVILECINCDYKINLVKFEAYTRETRDLYLQHYVWYPMPVSLHKILFHGKDIIETFILPIGAILRRSSRGEKQNTNRQFRELFMRKTSRSDTNTDVLQRLLITLDPFITSLRASPTTKHRKINPEMLNLLESEKNLSVPERDYSVDSSKDLLDECSVSSDSE